jgi:Copper type II ascorbate-dependent monooxygenase, C-terminal domain
MLQVMQKSLLLTVFLLLSSCEKPWDYNPDEIPNNFVPLPVPAPGTGFQLYVPPFPIPPQFEREWYMRLPVGNTEEAYVSGYEMRQREGSHHLIAYQFKDENDPMLPKIGELRDQNRPDGRINFYSNMQDMRMLAEAASPYQKVEFPAGFALPIAAGSTLDLNSHYFNKSDRNIYGEVTLNLYTVPKSEVQHFLQQGEVDNELVLVLPPKQTTVIEYSETVEDDRRLKVILSHMHKRGKKFEVFKVGGTNDGEKIYESNDWHDPNFVYLTDYILIKKGEGLRTRITYENETDRTIKFGVTSEDEMGIFFYFYY